MAVRADPAYILFVHRSVRQLRDHVRDLRELVRSRLPETHLPTDQGAVGRREAAIGVTRPMSAGRSSRYLCLYVFNRSVRQLRDRLASSIGATRPMPAGHSAVHASAVPVRGDAR